jgi:hypothetical protein
MEIEMLKGQTSMARPESAYHCTFLMLQVGIVKRKRRHRIHISANDEYSTLLLNWPIMSTVSLHSVLPKVLKEKVWSGHGSEGGNSKLNGMIKMTESMTGTIREANECIT